MDAQGTGNQGEDMSLPMWRVRCDVGLYIVNVVVHARYHEEAEKMAEIEVASMKIKGNPAIRMMTTTPLVLP